MLRLKGEAFSDGIASGRIRIADMEPRGSGLLAGRGSPDHLSGSIFVLGSEPTPASLAPIARSAVRGHDCAIIVNHGTSELAAELSSLGIAAVSGLQPDYFLAGDSARVDGGRGIVEVDDVSAREVVSCLVQSGGKTLILKRSEKVGSWQGKWAAVSGYVEEGESPAETAFKEIREELSVERPELVRGGPPVITRKEGIVWISHPFLFTLEQGSTEIRIDWEHTDFRWITLNELNSFDTVPGLGRMLAALGLG